MITILDDGLEYALGIHAATNIYGAGFVTYEGSALQTNALVKVGQVNPLLMVILFYCSMIVFYLIVKRMNGMGDWALLTSPIAPDEQDQTAIPPIVNRTNTSENV